MSIELKPNLIEMESSLNRTQDLNELNINNNNSNQLIINSEIINKIKDISSKRQKIVENHLFENKIRKSLRKSTRKPAIKEIFISNELLLQKDFEITKLRKENQKLRKTIDILRKENHLLREQLTKSGLNTSEIIIASDLDLICGHLLTQNINNKNDIKTKLKSIESNINNENSVEFNVNEEPISDELNTNNRSDSLVLNSSQQLTNNLNASPIQSKNSDEQNKVRRKIHDCGWPGCDRTFANKYHLQRHELTHSGEKPFKCDFNNCKFATRDEYSLGVHRRQHTGERPYMCTYPGCKFRAAQSGNLMSHKLKHTGEMPFKCDWPGCELSFRFRSTYVYHKKVHINDKSFVCSFGNCGKSFIYRNDLKNHEAIHTGERKYKCSWPGCDKTYIQKNGLTNHLKWHTGDRRFGCDWPGCEWKSLSAHGLVKHKKTHTGERPFPCDRCDRKFADESNLRSHQRVVHNKERRFVCHFEDCNKSFTVRRLLTEHQMKENHK